MAKRKPSPRRRPTEVAKRARAYAAEDAAIASALRGGVSANLAAAEAADEAELHSPADAPPSSLPPFTVVGIGGSAGGLDAFTQLLRRIPADTGMAFVIVQHLAPTRDSLLVELLGARANIPVVEVTEGMPLVPDRVHVIPPGAEMLLLDGKLLLGARSPTREARRRAAARDEGGNGNGNGRTRRDARARNPTQLPPSAPFLPIDTFFRSLAEYARSRAIAVVLSGAGADGALGLKDVKGAGGITLAQDPRTADSDGMPRAAVATGAVDVVLPPADLADELVRIARHPLADSDGVAPAAAPTPAAPGPGPGRAPAAPAPAGPPEGLAQVFSILRAATGVDFAHYKLPTIRRRLHRRMVLHKVTRLEDYLRLLREHPAEVRSLYQDLLIHVTRFFRDPETFEMLARRVFPDLLAHRDGGRPVRIWVPGCSTGEEAYSVAMALLEHLGDEAVATPIQIFATDVSEKAIDQARAGIYPETISADVSPERLRRFFARTDGNYRINKAVRDLCVFARQDLTRDPPFSRLDLIVCRNVLIYLGPVLQRRLMTVFHYALKPTGFLMLGSAETVGPFAELFAVADKKHRLYTRKQTGVRAEVAFQPHAYGQGATAYDPPGVAGLPAAPAAPRPPTRGAGEAGARAGLLGEVNRILLARYVPPGVVVDGDYQVLQFRGQTGAFLEPAPGEASLNLLKMAREGLLYGLRSALHEARLRDIPVRKTGLRVRQHDGFREVNVEVVRLTAVGEARHFLVLFEDVTPRDPAAAERGRTDARSGSRRGKPKGAAGKARAGARARGGKGTHAVVERLEAELAASREYMQSVIQDLEAANEEILSSNEELQSTNEELDTAKEELQSTNEELNTLNEELHGRNEELSRVNSDLLNLLANVHIAIVMVASDLRIRRFTPTAEKVLNLIPSDVGRPISDIKPNVDCPGLEKLITESIDTVSVRECEVRDRNGRWYSLRVRPYKNAENKIDGAVIALIDLEVPRRGGRERERERERGRERDQERDRAGPPPDGAWDGAGME